VSGRRDGRWVCPALNRSIVGFYRTLLNDREVLNRTDTSDGWSGLAFGPRLVRGARAHIVGGAAPAWRSALTGAVDFDRSDRRAKARYPLQLGVRYRALGRPGVSGKGETANLSSQGAFVATGVQQELIVGSRLEAVVEWPILLEGNIALELVMLGRVMRVGSNGFAVAIWRHRFRTAKRRPGSIAIDRNRREVG